MEDKVKLGVTHKGFVMKLVKGAVLCNEPVATTTIAPVTRAASIPGMIRPMGERSSERIDKGH